MQSLPTFDLILFGGTGDLAMRKLLPALYRRNCAGQINAESRIIGAARSQLSRDEYLQQVRATCETHVGSAFDAAKWEQFAERLSYVRVDAQNAEDFGRLAELLRGQESRVRAFFLSTAPDLFAPITEGLARHSLVTPTSRVVLEKPLGYDGATSAEINERIGKLFPESNIFRIDHYLGKETVQNLLALRFGNQLFEPLWRRGRIQHVQITVAEEVGVERRAQFYDQIGALRDMIQNHMLQLLCIIAMEPPATGAADATRDEKLKVLRALRPLTGRDVLQKTVRGQYKAGAANGKPVVGYLEEKDVPNDSSTETFVALKVEIDFVALGWRAVLSAHRQAPAGEAGGDRHHVRGRAARNLRSAGYTARAQPAGDPVAAGGEHHADGARQEPGPWHGPEAGRPEPGLRRRVQGAAARRVRAVAHRRHQRHAARCSCGVTSWRRPGRGSIRSAPPGSSTTSGRKPILPAAGGPQPPAP